MEVCVISSVILLGTRGSVSMCGAEYARYGGATACVLVKMGGELIVLDGGTGILSLGKYLSENAGKFSLLLTHPHADHLIGLPCAPPLFDEGYAVDVYARARNGLSAREQFGLLMHKPLWPVGPEEFRAKLAFRDIAGDFAIGDVAVSVMESCHPGGSTVFRLSANGKSVVYATDFEHGETSAALESFARGCSLLIYDAQFTDEEYEARRGWGHSTWQEGLRLAEQAGAGGLVLTHHAPFRTDDALDALSAQLKAAPVNAMFGHCGEEIGL